jgi:hypothetical protein
MWEFFLLNLIFKFCIKYFCQLLFQAMHAFIRSQVQGYNALNIQPLDHGANFC